MSEITDSELARRLKDEFNYKCGPITDSTRNVYLKKLEKFINEKKVSPGRRRRTIATPLSINVNLDHDIIIRHSPRNRRQTNSNDVINKQETIVKNLAEVSARSPRRKTISNTDIQLASTLNKSTKKSPLGTENKSLAAFSSAESSGDEEPKANVSVLNSIMTSTKRSTPRPSEITSISSISPNPLTHPSINDSPSELRLRHNKVPLPRVYPKSIQSSKLSPRLRSLNSSALTNSPSLNLANFSDSETEEIQSTDENIKSITDHLMKYRPVLSRPRYSTRSSVKKSKLNGSKTFNVDRDEDDDDDDDDEEDFSSNDDKIVSSTNLQVSAATTINWIPFTIISLLCFFFIVIISLYLYSCITFQLFGKEANLVFNLGEDFNINTINKFICDQKHSDTKCIEKENLEPALIYAKRLHDVVKANLVDHLCETLFTTKQIRSNPYEYNLNEVRFILKSNLIGEDMVKYSESNNKFLTFANDIFNLIEWNPNWHMRIVEKFEVSTDILDKLSLSFNCRLYRLSLKLFTFLLSSFIVILPIGLIYALISFKYRRSKEEKQLVFEYVEKAIELLQSPDNPNSSIPINHVRDMLFSTQELQAKKFKKIWPKVIKHIKENESRVKVDLENIHGEDFETWRWIGPKKSTMKTVDNDNTGNDTDDGTSSTVMKTGTLEWQGQAFFGDEVRKQISTNTSAKNTKSTQDLTTESSQRSTRRIIELNENNITNKTSTGANNADAKNFTAPTEFLKVRNIFNSELQNNDSWKTNISNAILEKCLTASNTGKHGILHISVDDKNLSEGVVYIKCDSIESATKSFYALHGWWCERKLVSVRFLKEERYYLRFPEARFMNKPMTRSDE